MKDLLSRAFVAALFLLQLGGGAASAQAIRPFERTPLDPELFGPPQQTVVLLTSLHFGAIPLFIRATALHHFPGRLEGIFRGAFVGQGYRIRVVHEADQHDLWSALRDPSTVGLVWLSHGGGASGGDGYGTEGVLIDHQYFNILPALQGIHPNLRFLGVVGCKSESALENYFVKHGIRAKNPNFVFRGFDSTVEPRQGLREVVAAAKTALDRPEVRRGYVGTCATERGYGVRVTRRFTSGFASPTEELLDLHAHPTFRRMPAVRIQHRDEVLAVLPAGWNGGVQQTIVNIPLPEGSVRSPVELKFLSNIGENYWLPTRPLEVGRLSFEAPWAGAAWSLFAKPDGSPIGVTAHVYRYQGLRSFDVAPVSYHPDACEPMPARRLSE